MARSKPQPVLCPVTLREIARQLAVCARRALTSRDIARRAGRETVALCRESDHETLMRAVRDLRKAARLESKHKRGGR